MVSEIYLILPQVGVLFGSWVAYKIFDLTLNRFVKEFNRRFRFFNKPKLPSKSVVRVVLIKAIEHGRYVVAKTFNGKLVLVDVAGRTGRPKVIKGIVFRIN